jgi:choline dehydrogenase-like flavoprotein
MEGNRAVGIEYVRCGKRVQAYAGREVILAGGVFNSPQLLMLSGIGPADHLKQHGITTLIDVPGIGQNLQDHLGALVSGTRPVAGPFRREMRFDRMALNMTRAYLFGTGPATALPGGLHGYVRTDSSRTVPDIQLTFRGVSAKPHLWFPGIAKPYPDQCGVRTNILHPQSRGRIELHSLNPLEHVRIFSNHLAVDQDIGTMIAGVRVARELLRQKALDGYRGKEISPGPECTSDRNIAAWLRKVVSTVHHPSGTCAMGTHPEAVVDGALRVHGTERLRVVDGSTLPDLVSGNINACVIMIAEKASDTILGKPFPPSALA